MRTVSPSKASHFETVDLLRGLSIVAVVLIHVAVSTQTAHIPLLPKVPGWILFPFLWNGNNGVKVFFVVSGFLITITSIRRFGGLTGMQAGRFYRIRFARIAPLLLLVLALLSLLHAMHIPGFAINTRRITLLRAVIAALTFHINWLMAWRGYLPLGWDVLWSLSVEEMFYLFFPLACLLLLRLRHGLPIFIAVLLAFVVMGPFARTVWTPNLRWQLWSYLGAMDGIALGCLTALLTDHLQKHARLSRALLLSIQAVGAALMLLVVLWPHIPDLIAVLLPPYITGNPRPHFIDVIAHTGLDATILSLGTALVILSSALLAQRGALWSAPFRWCGRHSYEIYLTHEFVLVIGLSAFQLTHRRGNFTIWFGAILLATGGAGWLVARFFSEPLNRRLRGPDLRGPENLSAQSLPGAAVETIA